MGKITVLLLLAVLIALPAYAGGVTDSVKALGHMKYSLTVEDNYIFTKEAKKKNSIEHKMEDVNQIYGKASLGLGEYFNLYGKLGASDSGDIKRDSVVSGKALKIDTDYGFFWGLGLAGVKEISDGWKVGLDAQYDSWQTDVRKITHGGNSTSNASGQIQNREFQVTPFVTKSFSMGEAGWNISPYVGMPINWYWTDTNSNLKYRQDGIDREESFTQRGKDYVGLLVGADIEFTKNIALAVEGRFFEETALTGGLTYRF